MEIGVQINDTLGPNEAIQYFTWGWDPSLDVIWTVVPTSPIPGNPEIQWSVSVERASDTAITYWITVQNLISQAVQIEGRYAILNV
jgi:hypothetical protein